MSELVRVYATADQVSGQLLRGRLESEGITVLLKGDGEGPYRAGPVYLFVDEQDEARAKAVIDAVASGAYALDEGEPADPERSQRR
jgi:putative signal transducing protein